MHLSIRNKIFLSITLMLIPILLMLGISYFQMQRVLFSFERVIEESLHEMVPIHELRLLMTRSAMPANDYLIHGNKMEREEFATISAAVDGALQQLLNTSTLQVEKKAILDQLQLKWERNKQSAHDILFSENPVGDKVLAQKMEDYDRDVTALSNLLEEVDSIVHRKLQEYYESAVTERDRLLLNYSILIASSVCIVILASTFLVRKILLPLQILQQGAHIFGSGDLRYRISYKANDELGKLASTFNRMADELEKLATRDELTGLFNKREFERLFGDELNRSTRYGQPFSLLMIDLDHFKSVNDKYGHPVGDKVLQIFSAFVTKLLRPNDLAIRFGGEELAVILPQADQTDAMTVAERIRSSVMNNIIHLDNKTQINLTVSIGIATCPQDGTRMEMLVSAADQALYSAKHAGRNRVVLFTMAAA